LLKRAGLFLLILDQQNIEKFEVFVDFAGAGRSKQAAKIEQHLR